jgi:bacterioferritin-associated ferredoxin
MYICICNGITEREIRGAANLRSCAGCPKNAAFGGGHD